MSDTAAETKETTPVAALEKKNDVCERKNDVCERKSAAKDKEEVKEESLNGKDHSKDNLNHNGDAKEAEEEEEEENGTSENGESESTDVCSLPQKRKSEVGNGDTTDSPVKDGASPEKKAKLEEKTENGEAEATA